MKKSILVFLLATLFLAGSLKVVMAQEQPKTKKDTVNIDTDAKPTFYYAEEEKNASKSNTGKIVIIAGVVIVAGAAAYFFLKKKK
jgi:LPXTG-motif cell wall-anchored protein